MSVLTASALAAPRVAIGQSGMPSIGFLNGASPDTYRFNADSFREGLARAGFVEGRNVRIEERWARGNYDLLPRLAAELVALGVVAIAATGDVASARAAQQASPRVPVVFTIGADPMRFGLVQSMNRPGGHVTGVSLLAYMLGAKRVELLREIAPTTSRIAMLMNPSNPNAETEQTDAATGGQRSGIDVIVVNASSPDEIDAAFQRFQTEKVDAFITGSDPILLDRREQIVALATRHLLPAVYFVRQFVPIGGLLSYGPSISWMYRQAGEYIGQILKGANPAEMPVMQPTQFEFVINMKTAGKFGLDIRPQLLARADEVID